MEDQSLLSQRPQAASDGASRDDYIPRPANAFILFRTDFVKSKKITKGTECDHRNISKIAGTIWRSLPEADKKEWHTKAVLEKERHMRLYPGYRCPPPQRREGISRRKVKQRVWEGTDSDQEIADVPDHDEMQADASPPSAYEPSSIHRNRPRRPKDRCDVIAQLYLSGVSGQDLEGEVKRREQEGRRRRLEAELQAQWLECGGQGSLTEAVLPYTRVEPIGDLEANTGTTNTQPTTTLKAKRSLYPTSPPHSRKRNRGDDHVDLLAPLRRAASFQTISLNPIPLQSNPRPNINRHSSQNAIVGRALQPGPPSIHSATSDTRSIVSSISASRKTLPKTPVGSSPHPSDVNPRQIPITTHGVEAIQHDASQSKNRLSGDIQQDLERNNQISTDPPLPVFVQESIALPLVYPPQLLTPQMLSSAPSWSTVPSQVFHHTHGHNAIPTDFQPRLASIPSGYHYQHCDLKAVEASNIEYHARGGSPPFESPIPPDSHSRLSTFLDPNTHPTSLVTAGATIQDSQNFHGHVQPTPLEFSSYKSSLANALMLAPRAQSFTNAVHVSGTSPPASSNQAYFVVNEQTNVRYAHNHGHANSGVSPYQSGLEEVGPSPPVSQAQFVQTTASVQTRSDVGFGVGESVSYGYPGHLETSTSPQGHDYQHSPITPIFDYPLHPVPRSSSQEEIPGLSGPAMGDPALAESPGLSGTAEPVNMMYPASYSTFPPTPGDHQTFSSALEGRGDTDQDTMGYNHGETQHQAGLPIHSHQSHHSFDMTIIQENQWASRVGVGEDANLSSSVDLGHHYLQGSRGEPWQGTRRSDVPIALPKQRAFSMSAGEQYVRNVRQTLHCTNNHTSANYHAGVPSSLDDRSTMMLQRSNTVMTEADTSIAGTDGVHHMSHHHSNAFSPSGYTLGIHSAAVQPSNETLFDNPVPPPPRPAAPRPQLSNLSLHRNFSAPGSLSHSMLKQYDPSSLVVERGTRKVITPQVYPTFTPAPLAQSTTQYASSTIDRFSPFNNDSVQESHCAAVGAEHGPGPGSSQLSHRASYPMGGRQDTLGWWA